MLLGWSIVLWFTIMCASWYCSSSMFGWASAKIRHNRNLWESSSSPVFEDQSHLFAIKKYGFTRYNELFVCIHDHLLKECLKDQLSLAWNISRSDSRDSHFNFCNTLPCSFAFYRVNVEQNRKRSFEYLIQNLLWWTKTNCRIVISFSTLHNNKLE